MESTAGRFDEIVLGEAREAFARGRLVEARFAFERAFEGASDRRDAETMARAVLGLGGLWVNEQRAPDEYAQYRAQLTDTLQALGGTNGVLSARVNVRLTAEARYAEGAQIEDARRALARVQS